MKIDPLLLAKIILTVAVLLLVGTLAVLKLIPPEQVMTLTVGIIGALVVALGLTAAGRAAGAGTVLSSVLDTTSPAPPADPAARLASLEQAVAALSKAASSPAPAPPKLPGGAGGFARVSLLAHVAVLVVCAGAAVLVLTVADALTGCSSATPAAAGAAIQAEGARVNDFNDRLAHCRAVGRDAGTYTAYAACEVEAGL